MLITLRNKNQIFRAGSNAVVIVGQTSGCDLRIPNHTQYEDVVMAKIVPDVEANEWHIVRLTHYYPILINGIPMHRVHYLKDGDNIEFLDASYKFSLSEGDLAFPSLTYVGNSRKLIWGICAAFAVLAVVIGFLIFDRKSETLSSAQRTEIAESMYLLRVDSLHLMRGDTLVESYVYASAPTGSAFLTTDSLLVTARHCLQPWLNAVLPEDYATIPSLTDWPVSKALLAETQNQLNDSSDWRIVSFISLSSSADAENVRNTLTLTSDQFTIPTDHDEIIELGDYNSSYYWRSISHRYNREDMMLGDIAYAHFDRAGSIPLASEKEIRDNLMPGTRLTFVGFPESSLGTPRLDFKTDELHHSLRDVNNMPGELFLLTHDGHLSHGFSGGPVLVRFGIGYKAVGIISLTDAKNDSRSYSVPTTRLQEKK